MFTVTDIKLTKRTVIKVGHDRCIDLPISACCRFVGVGLNVLQCALFSDLKWCNYIVCPAEGP